MTSLRLSHAASRAVRVLLAVIGLCAIGVTRAEAQTCRPADSLSNRLLDRVLFFTRGWQQFPEDTALRTSLGQIKLLALNSTSEVTLVTSEALCKKAAAAYRAAVPSQATRLSGKVYVIQAGRDRFVVVDPTWYYTTFSAYTMMTLDTRYAVLAKWIY